MAIYKEEMKKDSVRIVNDVFWYSMTMFTMDQQFQKSQVSGDLFCEYEEKERSHDVSHLSDPGSKKKHYFLIYLRTISKRKAKQGSRASLKAARCKIKQTTQWKPKSRKCRRKKQMEAAKNKQKHCKNCEFALIKV